MDREPTSTLDQAYERRAVELEKLAHERLLQSIAQSIVQCPIWLVLDPPAWLNLLREPWAKARLCRQFRDDPTPEFPTEAEVQTEDDAKAALSKLYDWSVRTLDRYRRTLVGAPRGDKGVPSPVNGKGTTRRKRRQSNRPLTEKRKDIFERVAIARGDYKKVADDLSLSRQYVERTYKRGEQKVKRSRGPMPRKRPRKQAIPTDKRGQSLV